MTSLKSAAIVMVLFEFAVIHISTASDLQKWEIWVSSEPEYHAIFWIDGSSVSAHDFLQQYEIRRRGKI